ncbi:MAG: SPOR domain-containing protein [Legionella sp.]|nr:SPOR domain-containing protein [Legionella sp.]
MKFVMDERFKHRLVGIAVILSIAAIFVPAIMKKSNQRFEKTIVSIKLPTKPALPVVAMPEKQTMFRSVKVAHVNIPSVKDELKPISTIAKAEPLSQMNELRTAPAVALKQSATLKELTPATEGAVSKDVTAQSPDRKATAKTLSLKAREIKKTPAVKALAKSRLVPVSTSRYSVQLGTFSQQTNAVSLVNKLKTKGYKAFFSKTNTKNGTVYKVMVGPRDKKQEAEVLQQQLAEMTKLKGIVVASTGIS